ncbi:hypothetical protein [Hymenobacter nivis]|uniref:Uncharacterized protein n=1 Tax=Hymenobacter nivis TaxID=1850093 RepID=A0A502GX82_9BACT|nr:hypothetical protein [Hymenobacter nivis]TPG66062.1 hypothetical protein EAH73_11880 [Hymenobacter nivis]
MRLVTLSPHDSVLLHESIFQLPAGQHNDFQHYLVRDAGIGADPGAVDRHFAHLGALLAAAQQDPASLPAAADELALLHYAFNDMLDRFNPRQLAFGCLVVEVNGEPWADRSEEGLRRLLTWLSGAGLTEERVADIVATVKKNCQRS